MKDAALGAAEERFTTAYGCKSWHGSLNSADSLVPFVVAYPGGNKSEIGEMLERKSACSSEYSDCRGNWKLPTIVDEIISDQYK